MPDDIDTARYGFETRIILALKKATNTQRALALSILALLRDNKDGCVEHIETFRLNLNEADTLIDESAEFLKELYGIEGTSSENR